MTMITKLIFLFIACTVSIAKGMLIENNNTLSELQQCVANLEETIFSDSSTIYIVEDKHPYELFTRQSLLPHMLLNARESITGSYPAGKNFIIEANNESSLSHLINLLENSPVWNENESPFGKFLIVMLTGNPLNVFQILWERNIINFVIAGKENGDWKVFSSSPYYTENMCGNNTKKHLVSNCSSTLIIGFAKPTSKIGSCKITLTNSAAGTHAIEIAKAFGRFSTHRKRSASVTRYKRIRVFYPIYTATAMDRGRQRSNAVFRNYFVWISPEEHNMFTLNVIFSLFNYEVWILTILGLIITSLTWCAFLKIAKSEEYGIVGNAFMNVICLTLCGCIRIVPARTPLRIILVLYLFYVIVIQTAFKANLLSALLSNTDSNRIESVEDVANSKLPICMLEGLKTTYFCSNETNDEVYIKIRSKIKVVSADASLLSSRRCIYLLSSTDFTLFLNKQWNASVVKDSEYTTGLSLHLVLQEPHFVISPINELITRWKESGIFDYDLKRIMNKTNRNEDTEPTPLALKHVSGVFAIWGFGMVIATIVFILEHIIYKFHP